MSAQTSLAAAPTGAAPAKGRMPALFARSPLGRVIWSFRREFAWVGIFSMFTNLLLLTPTLYMLQVFDRVLISGSEVTLAALTAISLVFFLVMGFAEWVRSRLLVRAGAKLDLALSDSVFRASFEQNLRGNNARSTQAFTDLTQLRQFLTGNGIFALFDAPWIPLYLGVLFMMHPVLGWTAVGISALLAIVAVLGNRMTAPLHEKAQESANATSAYILSKLRNSETVEALGMVGSLRKRWLHLHEKQLHETAHAHEISHRVLAVTKFVQYMQGSVILAVGALLAIDGKISVGAMVAVNALAGNAMRPIGLLVGTWKQYVDSRMAYGRLEKLFEDNPEAPTQAVTEPIKGAIEVRNLVASAPGRSRPILGGINVSFNAGEVIGIVGPSGAGKSTFARCLLGIWPGAQGEVLLDGTPIKNLQRDQLGPQLGYLPQDIEMFDGTIAENIARFGDMSSERVIEAATRTGIHDMILRFPKGYDTPMGEAGGLLSGGQRQRIGLARAIYGSPGVIVLDEPNASLDDAGEAALIRTVRDLRAAGKTVFMVVHLSHLLAVTDRVLVLENGQVRDFGPSPAALAANKQSTARIEAQA